MHRTPRGGALAGARESLCAPASSGSAPLCLSFSILYVSPSHSVLYPPFPLPLSLTLPRDHPPSWTPDCGATDTHPVSVYLSLIRRAKGLREREGSGESGGRGGGREGERTRAGERSLHTMGMGNGTPRNIGGH